MAVLQELIVSIRNLRAELKVETKARVPIEVHAADGVRASIERNQAALERLAGVEGVRFLDSLARSGAARSTSSFDVAVAYQKPVDPAAERARLQKELKKYEGEMANAQRQLGNQQFLAKAPAQVVEGIRRRQGELEVLLAKTRSALKEL
jgi:valyl-tRNA synthetase